MYTYDKNYYATYGFKVTDEPIISNIKSEAEQDDYENSYDIIFSNRANRTDILTIKTYIQQYPHNPSFKNHLSVLYGQLGMDLEAMKTALEVVNRHPDYGFGRISLAENSIKDGNLDMAKKMLGEPRNIRAFLPNTDVFHFSEFMAYHAVTGMYEMEIDNRDAAEKNLELMIEYDPDHGASKRLANYIIQKSFEGTQKRMKDGASIDIKVASFPTYTPDPTDAPPKLHHEELEAFYLYPKEELPEEVMTDIMQLPRETLIADLEVILEDSIRRYDYFQEKYIEEFNESEQCFIIHAIYFLGALEAKESLNTLLNVFRQGEEFLEYWFADYFEGYCEESLFLIAKDQPEVLKNYTLEANQDSSSRSLALDILIQIALHFPEKRDEIIGYIKEICDYHFAHPDNKSIIDINFLTELAGAPMVLREASLLDYARQIDEREWLGYMMFGDLEKIKEETNSPPEAADLKPLPLDIYEFYNGNYTKRRARYSEFEDIEKKLDSKVLNYLANVINEKLTGLPRGESNASYDDNEFESAPSRYEYQDPIVNTTPKVGRNAPCPCGSGKKHKRCCLKKAS